MQITLAFMALLTVVTATPKPGTVEAPAVRLPLSQSIKSVADVRPDRYDGVATYYTQNGNAGSCGQYHGDGDYIAALRTYWMGSDGTHSCGGQIQITNMGGGQDNNGYGNQVTVTVADTCEGCDETHIDLAEGPFQQLTGGNLDPPGEFNIQWYVKKTSLVAGLV